MTGPAPALAGILRGGLAAGYAALHGLGLRRRRGEPVAFVTEGANWTIRWVGESYVSAIEARHPGTVALTHRPYAEFDRVLHFGSQFFWQAWAGAVAPSNRVVVSFFHGKPEDGPEMARHIDYFLSHHQRVARVVTAAGLVERRLLGWGVPRDKLVHVPLGVDVERFRPPDPAERARLRRRFGIPDGALCVGSFQKDGTGWSSGNEPKLIKGPDIFVEVMARLGRDLPVFALLSGPARGYVRQGLDRHGIPYKHEYFDAYHAVADCYRALDLYLVTSREEGGPQSLLESMASGVPLISTRVGMAEDVIDPGINGALVEVDDVVALVREAAAVLSDPGRAGAYRAGGLRTAERYRWTEVGERLYQEVYHPLIA